MFLVMPKYFHESRNYRTIIYCYSLEQYEQTVVADSPSTVHLLQWDGNRQFHLRVGASCCAHLYPFAGICMRHSMNNGSDFFSGILAG